MNGLLKAVCGTQPVRRRCARPATLRPYTEGSRYLGQWLCVPPFRVVCLYQVLNFVLLRFQEEILYVPPRNSIFLIYFNTSSVISIGRRANILSPVLSVSKKH